MVDRSRLALAFAASVLALAAAAPAHAQTADPQQGSDTNNTATQTPAQTQPAADQATSNDNGSQDPDTIVVTAQRRQERLVDVPISITAIGGDQLQQNVIVSTSDLSQAVPGLTWGRSTNFSQPTIRGIGSRNASAGDEPNVASFLDGVYLPDMTGTLLELSSIERIEVLRGPQGTLFGRNATGGAINIITRAPTSDWEASIAGSIGSYGYHRENAYLSGPLIGDLLTFSVSAVNYDDTGYVRNVYTGAMQGRSGGTAVRGRLRLQPSDKLQFELNGFYSRSNNNVLLSGYSAGGNSQARNAAPGGPNAAVLNPTGLPVSALVASQPYTTATYGVPVGRTLQRFVDGHASWDLGFATLTGQVSFGGTDTDTLSWTDISPLRLSQTEYSTFNKFRNQELVLTSNPHQLGRLEFLLGLTRFQSDAQFNPLRSTQRNVTTGVFTPTTTIYGQNTRAYAVFGELTWEPVDHLFITGGLRYNQDDKTAFNINGATNVRTNGAASFENTSPRGVVRWEFARDSNVYVSFVRGFKSGTFNAVTVNGTTIPATPEIVDSYEIGAKVKLFGGVSLDASAFHYDYSDLQVSSLRIINGVSATIVQNAGQAKINGLEATLNARLNSHWNLNATVALLDTEIQNFGNAAVNVPRTDALGNPTLNGNLSVILDVSGNELIRAPDYTFTLGGTYSTPLFGGELSVNANAFFSGNYYFDLTNRLEQPAYAVVNGSITWRQGDHGLYLTAFVQNLTDESYAAGAIISTFTDSLQSAKPRWFGGTIGFNF